MKLALTARGSQEEGFTQLLREKYAPLRTIYKQGLRTNWSDLQHAYQKLSLLTDTLPKKMRREQVESQLDELERFVNLIEKHKVIVVADVGHGAAAIRF